MHHEYAIRSQLRIDGEFNKKHWIVLLNFASIRHSLVQFPEASTSLADLQKSRCRVLNWGSKRSHYISIRADKARIARPPFTAYVFKTLWISHRIKMAPFKNSIIQLRQPGSDGDARIKRSQDFCAPFEGYEAMPTPNIELDSRCTLLLTCQVTGWHQGNGCYELRSIKNGDQLCNPWNMTGIILECFVTFV